MARPNVPLWGIGCLFTVLVLPRSASADLINLTGGFVFVAGRPDSRSSVQLIGERGFSLTGFVAVGAGSYDPDECNILGCNPGTAVSLGAAFSGSALGGTVTFEGQTFTEMNQHDSHTGVDFTGSFIAPPFASSAVVTAPFGVTGAFSISPEESGREFPFGHNLIGSGLATIKLSPSVHFPLTAWRVDSVRYDIAAPIPEPGTMLLVGLGIIGVGRRLSRARASVA